MDKTIIFVELTFENIDWIEIHAEYFRELKLGVVDGMVGTSVELSLKAKADREGGTFRGDVNSIQHEHGTLFDRLHRNDITSIRICYGNDSEEAYAVAWEDEADDEYINRLQTTIREQDGSLSIRIGVDRELWTWCKEVIL